MSALSVLLQASKEAIIEMVESVRKVHVMKVLLRKVVLFVEVIVTVIFAVGGLPSAIGTASAESACALNTLSAADCKLIADAGNNLASMKTFMLDYTASLNATGLPNGNVRFSTQGTGPVDISKASGSDLSAILGNVVLSSKLTSSATVANHSDSGPLELRMVGGWVYLNGSRVTQGQWEKFSISKVVAAALGSSARLINASALNFDGLAALQKFAINDVPGAYQARSQPGRTVDGQATTQISVDLNIYTYLSYLLMPNHRDQLAAIVRANFDQRLTPGDLDELARLMPLFKNTLQATKLTYTWLIGKKDELYHGYAVAFSTKVDPGLLVLMGAAGTGPTAQPINAVLNFQVTLSKVGKPVAVQSVDNATDITDQLLNGFPLVPGFPGNLGNPPVQPANTQPVMPPDVNTHYAGIQTGTSPEGFATLGDPKAPVQIVQLSSYSCGACQRYYTTQIVPVLDEIKSGRVYYTFIPVSLTGEFDAAPATAAAYCALQQGKFWQMHDVLFDWQLRYGSNSTDSARLSAGAKALGMDATKFSACLSSADAVKFVKVANDRFSQLNLHQTPSVYVNGRLFFPTPGGNIPDLRATIDQLATGNGPAPQPLQPQPPPPNPADHPV